MSPATPGFGAANAGDGLAEVLGSARRRWRWILASALVVAVLGGLFSLRQAPTYRAVVELLIDPQALQIVGRGLSRPDAPPQIDFANLESQSLILLSAKLLDRVITGLGLADDRVLLRGSPAGADPRSAALEGLRRRITVRRVDASLTFQLTVAYPDPRRAAEIANAVAAAYFEVSSDDRLAAVRRANETLLTQLGDLRGQLNRADLAVERYRSEKRLIASGDAGLLITQQLRDLYTQITVAEADLAKLSARREQAKQWASVDGGVQATPETGASSVMVSLRAKHAQVVQEIAQASRSLGPAHPSMIALVAQRTATAQLVAAEADRIRRTTDEELRRGEEGLRQLRGRAETLVTSQASSNEEAIRLRQLESEADAIRRTYNLVLGRIKDLEQQEVINTNNSQIVSPASPPLKSSDTPLPVVVAAGLLFGAVFGVIGGTVFDRWRGNVATAAGLASVGVPVWARLSAPDRGNRPGADERALVGAARVLRERLTGRARATVTVASDGLGGERLHAARILTELLIRLGEPARRASGGLKPRGARVRPRGTACTAARDGAAREGFVVTEWDLAEAESWLAVPETSDAILLVVTPGRTRRRDLDAAVEALDGGGHLRREGLIGIVAVEPARARLGWRPARAAAPTLVEAA